MTDYTALLAACCSAPDDDTPRLVLADWLDDNGQAERAAFIRAAVATPGVYQPSPDMCASLAIRAGTYNVRAYDAVVAPYTAVLPGDHYAGRQFPFPVWERGFPAEVTLPAADWIAHGDALSWHPSEARTCPPTACPGLTVRLTTRPNYLIGATDGDHRLYRLRGDVAHRLPASIPEQSDEAARAMLAAEWPGVRAWHLPEPQDIRWAVLDRLGESMARDLDARAFGGPLADATEAVAVGALPQ